jgi:hypothetical protein
LVDKVRPLTSKASGEGRRNAPSAPTVYSELIHGSGLAVVVVADVAAAVVVGVVVAAGVVVVVVVAAMVVVIVDFTACVVVVADEVVESTHTGS